MRFLLIILILTLNSGTYCQNINYNDTDSIAELYIAEEMPAFPGGETALYKWLSELIKFPATDSTCISSKIFISFTIDTTGKVINPEVSFKYPFSADCKILETFSLNLQSEIIKMPIWTPGRQSGKKVNVRFNMPINIDWD